MHVGTDFLKLPPVTGQYWSLFQCSMLGTGGTCVVHITLSQQLFPPRCQGPQHCPYQLHYQKIGLRGGHVQFRRADKVLHLLTRSGHTQRECNKRVS